MFHALLELSAAPLDEHNAEAYIGALAEDQAEVAAEGLGYVGRTWLRTPLSSEQSPAESNFGSA